MLLKISLKDLTACKNGDCYKQNEMKKKRYSFFVNNLLLLKKLEKISLKRKEFPKKLHSAGTVLDYL